jgi:hypothetical protein
MLSKHYTVELYINSSIIVRIKFKAKTMEDMTPSHPCEGETQEEEKLF